MARLRRRRPTVAWLPHVTHEETEVVGWYNLSNSVLAATPLTGINTVVAALTVDYPAEAVRSTTEVPTMADFEGGGYRLRRIVGKVFANFRQDVGTMQNSYPRACLFTVGFMVVRVAPDTAAPLQVSTPNYYSPLTLDGTRDPWIWRRTWQFGNPFGVTPAVALPRQLSPAANWQYGSVADGPHIDQKTARRVSTDERLVVVASAVSIDDAQNTDGQVDWTLDYRILASPLKVSGNRRNASR